MQVRKVLGVVLMVPTIVGSAQAETWRGCVEVSNTSGVAVTATLDGYPGWTWSASGADDSIKYLTSNGQAIVMQGDSHDRPPIHFQPGNVPMIRNFFTRTAPGLDERGCVDSWRIVLVTPSLCNAVDNICR